MGLFRSSSEAQRSQSPPPAAGRTSTTTSHSSSSLFSRRSNSTHTSEHSDNLRRHDRTFGGPKPITSDTLTNAREGLNRAINHEKEAEMALQKAKASLREAKQHVEKLEDEARREAKLAKAKLTEAKSMRHAASKLGH
ncbi:hypothetical protein BT69DRAFT_1337225 [Atractiella rhizophila]|nr:hypothetical protein BT69DRAFT_1337225 [Atractiella rhizophila]